MQLNISHCNNVYISCYNTLMFNKREGKWLIGVSGGPDSMALLHMCYASGMDIVAAHVNYHVRDAADEEETYVRNWCEQHGIVCYVRNEPFVYSGNFEAAARSWRYDFFVMLVNKYGLSGMLCAHHQDDLLETYIMQKEKNIVPLWYGLKEESTYHGVHLVRPLLSYTKEELVSYCHDHNIRYYIDHTNLEPVHTRNVIRKDVSSFSKEQRMELLKEIDEENEKLSSMRLQAETLFVQEKIDLLLYRKAEKDIRLTALRRLVDEKGIHHYSRKYMEELDGILMKQDDFLLPCGEEELVQCCGRVYLQKKAVPYAFVIDAVKEMTTDFFSLCSTGENIEKVSVSHDDFPLTIRSAKEGDVITMRFGTKPVHRFFIDRHVPKGQRAMWPVVENVHGRVIFVAGLGCDKDHWEKECVMFVKHNAIC